MAWLLSPPSQGARARDVEVLEAGAPPHIRRRRCELEFAPFLHYARAGAVRAVLGRGNPF